MGEPLLRCKLRCNFRPSVHSFLRPPGGNESFRKRAERDAVTDVDARRPSGMRVSREHEARARARAATKRGMLAMSRGTATPDHILLGLEYLPGPSILLENDGRAAAGSRSHWRFVLAHPPNPVFRTIATAEVAARSIELCFDD